MPTDWEQVVYANWVQQWGFEEADRLAAAWRLTSAGIPIANTELDGMGWE